MRNSPQNDALSLHMVAIPGLINNWEKELRTQKKLSYTCQEPVTGSLDKERSLITDLGVSSVCVCSPQACPLVSVGSNLVQCARRSSVSSHAFSTCSTSSSAMLPYRKNCFRFRYPLLIAPRLLLYSPSNKDSIIVDEKTKSNRFFPALKIEERSLSVHVTVTEWK